MTIVKHILFVLELLVCYGTITCLLFVGYFYLPFYLAVVVDYFSSPEFYPKSDASVFVMLKPLLLVIGGTLGLVGIMNMVLNIFAAGTREMTIRYWPIAFFIIGNITLLFLIQFLLTFFGRIGGSLDMPFCKYLIILLPYVILPFIANAHVLVLYLSKRKKIRNNSLEET